MRLSRRVICLVFALLPFAAGAQQADAPAVRSPILTIESERFYAESFFGKRIAAEIEADSAVLASENRRIETELMAEEKALTEERKTLERSVFREKADAFDDRVQQIRRTQDAKARELARRNDDASREFLTAARPVLVRIMIERGASMIVERRNVFISAGSIDITDEAIRRINAAIGDGQRQQTTDGAADPTLDGAPASTTSE